MWSGRQMGCYIAFLIVILINLPRAYYWLVDCTTMQLKVTEHDCLMQFKSDKNAKIKRWQIQRFVSCGGVVNLSIKRK